jgi:GGDEF domain-containing protein
LIRKADEAMYSIKKSGKNNYAFAWTDCRESFL